MKSEVLQSNGFLVSFNDTENKFLQLVLSVSEDEINTVPYEDCWTVAQVAEHVTRSNEFIALELSADGRTSAREPDERAQELRDMFLNFSVKFQSPDVILPTLSFYNKKWVTDKLEKSIEQLKELSKMVNLSEAIEDKFFGNITKLELLHFVMYHTQRHIRQLENILTIINSKQAEVFESGDCNKQTQSA